MTRRPATRRKQPVALPPRSEAVVQRQAMKILRQYGIDAQRRNTRVVTVPGKGGKLRPMFFGQAGDPDIDGQLPDGRRLQIEVKKEGWNPPRAGTKAYPHWGRQLARLQKTNAANGVAFWVSRPEDLHSIIPLLLNGARVSVDDRGERFFIGKEAT